MKIHDIKIASLVLGLAAGGSAHAYTVDQLLLDLQGMKNSKISDLASANTALHDLGLPPITLGEASAILAQPQALQFVVLTTTTTYNSSTAQAQETQSTTVYSITNRASFNQLRNALKSSSSFQSDATGNFTSVSTSSSLTRIFSTLTGNSLDTVDGVPVCNQAGGGTQTLSSWAQTITCMGLGQSEEQVRTLSTLNQITLANFVFNRPTSDLVQNIRQMSRLRESQAGAPSSGPSVTGGSSGADQYNKINEDLGLYFGAGGSFGSVDRTAGGLGYSLYRRTATVGLDYRFSDQFDAGFLFNYLSSSSELNRASGSFYSDIYRFAPYASFTPIDNMFVDVSVGYGLHDNATRRNSIIAGNALQGAFQAHEGYGTVNIGYSYAMQGWTLTGYGQGSAIGMYLNRYTEKGQTAAIDGVKVPSNYALSVTTTLGAELNYAWSTAYGVLLPRVFAEWVHEYKNNGQLVAAQFVGSGLPALSRSGDPLRNWGNVGLGAQLQMPNALAGFVNFRSLVADGLNNFTIDGGVRWSF